MIPCRLNLRKNTIGVGGALSYFPFCEILCAKTPNNITKGEFF